MKRNFFVVVNPASGTKKIEQILRELIDFLGSKNYGYEIFLTAKSQNAHLTVKKELTAKYTDLLVIGGDGTINEAINGLKYDIPLSIIPTGSGNDFVKNIDIGNNLEDYLKVIDEGKIMTIDLGVCNERKFVNGVGVGFDGQIVADMQTRNSIFKGAYKYYYYVLRILASYTSRQFDFTKDKSTKQKQLILMCVANGTTFGGSFKLTPEALLDDGLLDVCEIGAIHPVKRFLNIHRLKAGSHGILPEVRISQCMHLRIEANPLLHAHIDGEYFGQPPFEFSILPHALKIRVGS